MIVSTKGVSLQMKERSEGSVKWNCSQAIGQEYLKAARGPLKSPFVEGLVKKAAKSKTQMKCKLIRLAWDELHRFAEQLKNLVCCSLQKCIISFEMSTSIMYSFCTELLMCIKYRLWCMFIIDI